MIIKNIFTDEMRANAKRLDGVKHVNEVAGGSQASNSEALSRFKEWSESPAYEVWLSEDAKKKAELKSQNAGKHFAQTEEERQVELTAAHENTLKATRELMGEDYRTEKQRFADAFNDVSGDFKEALKNKGTMYANQTELTNEDIAYDTIENMADAYDGLKADLEAHYSGDVLEVLKGALDEAYESAFESNILNPIKDIFDEKFHQLQPDDLFGNGLKISAKDQDYLQERLSEWIGFEERKEIRTEQLKEGTASFYELLSDKDKWHDKETVSGIIFDAVENYGNVKPTYLSEDRRKADKEYADKLAKEIADRVNKWHTYDPDQKGKDDEGNPLLIAKDGSAFYDKFNASIYDAVKSAGGWYSIDLSMIEDGKELWRSYMEGRKNAEKTS